MNQTKEQTAWDRVLRPWWAKIVAGIVLILVGIWQYNRLSRLESGQTESMYVGRTTKILYEVGGKWGVGSLAGIAGAGMIAWGAVQVARGGKE